MATKERSVVKAGAKATVRSDRRSTKPKIAKQSAFKAGLLGGMSAGLTVNFCLFPLNTLKTRLQSRPVGAAMGFADRSILRGLYRGFLIDTVGTFPGTGLFMATYEVLKATGALHPTLCAAGASVAGSLFTAPCDAMKQRMQVDPRASIRGELSSAFKSSSPLRRLFVGYPQFLIRDLPFDAIQMTSFEALKRWHSKTVEPGRPRTPAELAWLGGAAGAITGLLTTPLDVARTAEVCAMRAGLKCTGVACLRDLVRQGGAKVLLRGSLPRMVEISLGGVLYFSALEHTKRVLGYHDPLTHFSDDDGKVAVA